MTPNAQTKPFRTVVSWQIVATTASALVNASIAGAAGAISAALGGAVAVVGSVVYMLLVPKRGAETPWDSLGAVLRAEGAKIGVMVVLLWLVMTFVKPIVVVSFIGTFTVAVIIFSMAIFVRNPAPLEMDKNNVG
jgi:ATP synthase protein I